jgi:hypothetical protein
MAHALGRLVEQEQPRPGGQRDGDLQPALLAMRQEASELVGAGLQREALDQLLDPLLRRAAGRDVAQQAAAVSTN